MVLSTTECGGCYLHFQYGLGNNVALDFVRPAVDRGRPGLVEGRQNIDTNIADLQWAEGAAVGSCRLDHEFGDLLKRLGHPDLEHRDIRAQRFAPLELIGEARVKCRMILDIERNLGEAVAKDRVVEAAKVASTEGYRYEYSLVEKAEEMCKQTGDNISSMLQDVRAGKSTEIDAISGEILRRAELASLNIPRTRVIWQLVKGLEQR